MKNFILILSLLFSQTQAFCYCYYPNFKEPTSEFYFDNGKWYLELGEQDRNYPLYFDITSYDSIVITSRQGRSKVKDEIFKKWTATDNYIVITTDMLDVPLEINPLSDSITFHYYPYYGYYNTQTLQYGQGKTDKLSSLEQGQSYIWRYGMCSSKIYKTNYPTIGAKNSDFYLGITDFDKQKQEKLIECYPNPAHNKVTVSIKKEIVQQAYKMTLSDDNGKVIFSKNIDGVTSLNIDLNGLANGEYTVVVYSGEGVIIAVEKLLIQ